MKETSHARHGSVCPSREHEVNRNTSDNDHSSREDSVVTDKREHSPNFDSKDTSVSCHNAPSEDKPSEK